MHHLRPLTVLTLATSLCCLFAACGDDDAATVSFSAPVDGVRVAGALDLAMSADGITIEEAGEVNDGAGHFHVIADGGCVASGDPVPRDADHVHFGAGQSEGAIFLVPGAHELCLQAGDGAHTALDATDTVTVDIGIDDREQWCAVAAETDDLFTSADTGGEDFPVRQVSYENVRRLLAQMSAAIDQVDTDVREDVAEALEWASLIASAYVDAEDVGAAEAALMEIFGVEGIQSDGPASTWILDTCDVDIDG